MERPSEPSPDQFGVARRDLGVIPDFGDSPRIMGRCAAAFVATAELAQALSISAADWGRNFVGYIVVGFLEALVGMLPAGLLSLLACFLFDQALRLVWPRYDRLALFRKAQKEYRARLSDYQLWVRHQTEQYWRSLSGIAFEHALGRLLRKAGFQVQQTPATADGGVDLILERNGRRTVVQCKAHASKVGIGTARELVASMIDFNAHEGIIAATSGVTKPVQAYIAGKNIEVYDISRIIDLQRQFG